MPLEVQLVAVDDLPAVEVLGFKGLTEALSDCVRVVRGGGSSELTTHWIDRTIERIEANSRSADPVEIAAGNVAYLAVGQGHLFAGSLLYDEAPEKVPVADGIKVLDQLRQKVVRLGGATVEELLDDRPDRWFEAGATNTEAIERHR